MADDVDSDLDGSSDSEQTGGGGSDPQAFGSDEPPARIGRYRIRRKIGEGGMGVVYEAETGQPKRRVALKVMRTGHRDDSMTAKLFKREAQTLGRLQHPSIAQIYASGRTRQGQLFFAMELVQGETLAQWLERRSDARELSREELKQRLAVFRQICGAVAFAHENGIMHRDLKPSNILVVAGDDPTASVPQVKILDFGLARMTDTATTVTTVVTEFGKIQGTLPYMSPEQVRGDPDEIDARTDVYSLGVILYELLTGKLPHDFTRSTVLEAIRTICERPPAPLTTADGAGEVLDRDIQTITLKALAKERSERYLTVEAVMEDVDRYLAEQPILGRLPISPHQFRGVVEFLYNSALMMYNESRLEAAIQTLAKAIEIDPRNPILHQLKGRAHLALGQSEEGVKALREYIRLAPPDEHVEAERRMIGGVEDER